MPDDSKKHDNQTENPYDFIMNDPPKQKKSLLPKTDDKKQRTIFVVLGGMVLLILGILLFSFIFGLSNKSIANLEQLAKEQQEIIRVAEIGTQEAKTEEVQSFASNVQFSVSSAQQDVLTYLNAQKVELKSKQLSLLQEPKTDALLQTASDNSRFDDVFQATMIQQLTTYKNNLSDYFESSDSQSQKVILQSAYAEVSSLLEQNTEED